MKLHNFYHEEDGVGEVSLRGSGATEGTFQAMAARRGIMKAENSEAILDEFRSQVRQGQPINFRNFGLQNSALADLKKRESMEQVVKKKDYMADVNMQKRILNQIRVRQSKEANIFDKLSVSLSLD